MKKVRVDFDSGSMGAVAVIKDRKVVGYLTPQGIMALQPFTARLGYITSGASVYIVPDEYKTSPIPTYREDLLGSKSIFNVAVITIDKALIEVGETAGGKIAKIPVLHYSWHENRIEIKYETFEMLEVVSKTNPFSKHGYVWHWKSILVMDDTTQIQNWENGDLIGKIHRTDNRKIKFLTRGEVVKDESETKIRVFIPQRMTIISDGWIETQSIVKWYEDRFRNLTLDAIQVINEEQGLVLVRPAYAVYIYEQSVFKSEEVSY